MNWLLIALCLATVPPQQAKPYAQSVKRVKQDRRRPFAARVPRRGKVVARILRKDGTRVKRVGHRRR